MREEIAHFALGTPARFHPISCGAAASPSDPARLPPIPRARASSVPASGAATGELRRRKRRGSARAEYLGRWICGLCAEAVGDEIRRAGAGEITTAEALDRHVAFDRHLVAAVARLLRRCLDSPPPPPPPIPRARASSVPAAVPPVTVVLDGRCICHRILLTRHTGYRSLAGALRRMFVDADAGGDEGSRSVDADHGLDLSNAVPGHVVAYEDMEDDLLLAGDLNWKDFVHVAKRIWIIPAKSSNRRKQQCGGVGHCSSTSSSAPRHTILLPPPPPLLWKMSRISPSLSFTMEVLMRSRWTFFVSLLDVEVEVWSRLFC